MRIRSFMFGTAAVLCFGASANAATVIPTNQNGADTEVRESGITDDFGTTIGSQQFGASLELATRGIEQNTTASNDRSSIMYMKFEIAGLPNHTADPGFWATNNVFFRGYVRNTNLNDGRIQDKSRAGMDLPVADWERVKFNVLGLEPGVGRYADDNPAQANRTDRSGNAYTASGYRYDWAEGIGTGSNNQTSGISFVDAPGLTPHCMAAGNCADAYGDTNSDNIHKTLGVYDDFNSDARLLGEWEWPVPSNKLGTNRYPVGMPLEYSDENGNLKQLIFDAQDAGRTHVTLMMHLAIDTRTEANGGIFSTADFLNFNYLFNPKEKVLLENDNSWDPDGSGPLTPTGSPWSCNGATGAGVTNCPGMTLGDNSTGAFSPQLIVRVPEPTSVVLLALGALLMATPRRRS